MGVILDHSIVNCSLMVCEFMYSLSAIAVGIVIFNPPRRAGRESNSLSSLEHGSYPVSAGMNCSCIAFSRGAKSVLMFSQVLITYLHLSTSP